MSLERLAVGLRESRGFAHKADIAPLCERLGLNATSAIQVGDDCAAIPDGDGFLLLAIEGFLNSFVAADPHFAGFCGMMVNLSDIAAMGGRPIAVVDALWSRDELHARPILDGLANAARIYGVPIVGGHSNTRNTGEQLAVAVLGRAKHLLTSFAARAGERVLAAIDLRGRWRDPHPYWDATNAPASRLRGDLAILPTIAERGLCRAGKDISMAGIIGTALMLAEASGIGMTIDPHCIPRPTNAPMGRWLGCFPSFGFLLTASEEHVPEVTALFAERDIACVPIGQCQPGTQLSLVNGEETALVWDYATAPFIGCYATAKA